MANGQVAHGCGCGNPNCSVRKTGVIRKLDLEIVYTDKKQNVKLKKGVLCPTTITIRSVIKEFLDFVWADDIPPEDVRLVGLAYDGRYYPHTESETRTTLNELKIINGYTLYLEPSPTASPLKICTLAICGPDEISKADFKWYKAKTTLGMLFKYIVEEFSLQKVERERIHLLTIVQELDLASQFDLRLSEMNVHDRMTIHVNIIPSRSSPAVDKNLDVHVKYKLDNIKHLLDVANTETIGGLRKTFEKKLENRRVSDFKLFTEIKEEIHVDDNDRTLQSFGIKPDQTIFATFLLGAANIEAPLENSHNTTRSLSLSTKHKANKVTVICNLPSTNHPATIQVPVQITMDELIRRINGHIKNDHLVLSRIRSGSEDLDMNDLQRRLAEFGIKPNDEIQVTMLDKTPVHTSIVSTRTPSSHKTDTSSKTNGTKLKPVGLINFGNICYMNSAFQCLAHVPPLTDFFLKELDQIHSNDNDHSNSFNQIGEVTGAYTELLWNLWRCDENDYSFKPTDIKEKIGKMDSRFATADQQDAQEFMTFLLNAMHKELKLKNNTDKKTIIKQLFFGEIQSTITCTKCKHKKTMKSPISFLSIPLSRQERGFWVKFILKNGKDEMEFIDVPISGRVEHLVDKFTQLRDDRQLYDYILPMAPDGELDYKTPLIEVTHDEVIFFEQADRIKRERPAPLPINKRKSTLENSLEDFLSTEELEDSWSCEGKCKKKTKAHKELTFCTLPTILIIQFKRFSHENGLHQKIETFVEYPIEDLSVTNISSSSERTIYDLIAVSNHTGSIFAGHYTACARRTVKGKHKWFKFDDSAVTAIPYEEDVVSRDAYLLFYIKRDMSENTVETTFV